MLRDERFWDAPADFKPERFLQGLKEGQVDPKSLVFGFGRRLATWLLQPMGFHANSGNQDLPRTRYGKPDCSSLYYDPSLGFRNYSRGRRSTARSEEPSVCRLSHCVRPSIFGLEVVYSFYIKLQRAGPFPLSIPTAFRKRCSTYTRGCDRRMRRIALNTQTRDIVWLKPVLLDYAIRSYLYNTGQLSTTHKYALQDFTSPTTMLYINRSKGTTTTLQRILSTVGVD